MKNVNERNSVRAHPGGYRFCGWSVHCILGEPTPPAVRQEKAPPFRRASRLLLKAVHVHEHVHVNVNVYVGRGVNTPGPLTKPVVVDVLVAVDGC